MEMGKLIELQINDLKTIDLVELTMNENGELINLEGDNGVGKSTVIEGIESLFNGGALPPDLIRNGKDEATVEGTFSKGYRVKRRIRKNKKGQQVASLDVFRPDGAKISAPQSVLKEVFESFASPAKIANAFGAGLYDAVVPLLPVDITSFEPKIEAAQKAMTEANAVVNAQGKRDMPTEEKPTLPKFDRDTYDAKCDQLGELRDLDVQSSMKRDQIRRLELQIKAAKLEVKELETFIHDNDAKLSLIPEVEMVVGGMKEARDFREHAEELVKAWDIYEDWFEGLNSASRIAVGAKANLDKLRKEKIGALAVAVAPGGVTVDEIKNVFIDGVIWSNCAFSERLKAAILMQLAGIPEGKLKLVFIEHGESMNRIKRQEVAKAAIEQGATVFMEIFNEDVKELKINSQTAVDPSWAAPVKKTVELPPAAPDEPVQFDPFEDNLGKPEIAGFKEDMEPDFDDGLDIF